MNKGHKHT